MSRPKPKTLQEQEKDWLGEDYNECVVKSPSTTSFIVLGVIWGMALLVLVIKIFLQA